MYTEEVIVDEVSDTFPASFAFIGIRVFEGITRSTRRRLQSAVSISCWVARKGVYFGAIHFSCVLFAFTGVFFLCYYFGRVKHVWQ